MSQYNRSGHRKSDESASKPLPSARGMMGSMGYAAKKMMSRMMGGGFGQDVDLPMPPGGKRDPRLGMTDEEMGKRLAEGVKKANQLRKQYGK